MQVKAYFSPNPTGVGYLGAISSSLPRLLPRGNRCAPAVLEALVLVRLELAAVSNFVEFSQFSVSITRDGATVRWSLQEMPHPGTG